MKRKKYTCGDIARVLKQRDSFVTVYLVDPLAIRLLYFIANYTSLTPNLISLFAFIFGVISAMLFYWGYFVIGATMYYLSFLFDCIDGKFARLKGMKSDLGFFYDASTLTHAYVLFGIALHFLFVKENKNIIGLILVLFLIQLQKNAMTIALKSVIPTRGSIYERHEESMEKQGMVGILIKIYSTSIGRAILVPTEIDLEFFTIILFAFSESENILILLLNMWVLYELLFTLAQFFISTKIIRKKWGLQYKIAINYVLTKG
ncbi:CDP-alcohol phosphatidyltransferase family protein [Thermococcus sp. 9N3]|uniref:CDP-alcohol phosphatidyltransferase family protein n=1 Tax=Thermococcus sp. 9N3 TaxID=163002 RepID=UPI00143101D4|nr:CDP-alcohol phosphatidyltransferase family protein [Thermococcus sp. 9N3]NJE49564.1 CDP-alcohol phosphatidyltransferase family protein [Thermococcus sp. 9N3]